MDRKGIEREEPFKNIKRIISKSFFTFLLILLYLCWGILPEVVLPLFHVNYGNLSTTSKVVITFLNDIGLILLFIRIYFKTIKRNFQSFFDKNFSSHLKIALGYWMAGLLVMIFSNAIINVVMDGQLAQNEETVRELIDLFPAYMAFEVMIYAPMVEELIFRKSIRDICQNKWIYVFVSGFVFGGLHVLSSLSSTLDLLYLIPYCALGFAFALLYEKTDNVFSSITVHAIHNGISFVLYLFMMVII